MLLRDSLDAARYGLGPPLDVGSEFVERPLLLSAAVVIGWIGLFYLVADLLLRRADIVE